jgi:hypothetical protein
MAQQLISKFAGRCAQCGQAFPAGTVIVWDGEKTVCVPCAKTGAK